MTTPVLTMDRRREWELLAAAGGCALLHQYFFFEHTWGVSYPLFFLAFYAYYYTAVGPQKPLRMEAPSLLLLPIALLSLTYAVYTNLVFLVLNAMIIPLLVLIHTVWHMRQKGNRSFGMLVLEQLFLHTVRWIPRPVLMLIRLLTQSRTSGKSSQVLKIALGLVLSVPLLLAVLFLLASADTVFDRTLAAFPDLFSGLNVREPVIRVIWTAVVTTGLFAFVCGLLFPKPDEFRRDGNPQEESQLRPAPAWDSVEALTPSPAKAEPLIPKLDATVAATMLIVLNTVYLLFAIVQFSYFFGGGAAALPEGITYAAYARKGFAELVFVTLINLSVLMVMLYGVQRPGRGAWRFHRILLALLTLFSGIMLSSAYLRLSMYEEAYGYSITRLLVHAFMMFLLVLFVLALVRLWLETFPLFRGYVVAGILAYVILNYANIDAIVARNNIGRYEAAGTLDTAYLSSLSWEAVPYVLELQRKHPEAPGVSEAVHHLRTRVEKEGPAWMEYNFSKSQAVKALRSLGPEEG